MLASTFPHGLHAGYDVSQFTIATRESRLALWQAEHVKALLEQRGHGIALLGMTTKGDQILDRSLSKVGGKGLFVKDRAVSQNACQMVRDAREDPDFSGKVDSTTGFVTRSVLCAPLATAQGVIGAIEVINKRDGVMSPAKSAMMRDFIFGVSVEVW